MIRTKNNPKYIPEKNIKKTKLYKSIFNIKIIIKRKDIETIEENIKKYGFSSRVASVRYARIPVLELKDENKAFKAIFEEAKRAIEKDGAEAIVLGCTGMSTLAKRLHKKLRVPVIDPAVASLKLAESYISMGLTTSLLAYETPLKKEII